MSGLLVKSTVIMRENLEEMNARGVSARWPVLLGGAALTRAYVEQDLASLYEGEVRYARDAFEGLRLMDALVAVKRGVPARRCRSCANVGSALAHPLARRSTARRSSCRPVRMWPSTTPVPVPPFWGDRVVKGIQLADYSALLDERATFMGQWGLRGSRGDGPSYDELVETEGRPRLRVWLERLQTDGLLEAAVVYGYFPCVSKGDDLIVLREDGSERLRFTFPRQRRDRHLCLSDFFRPEDSGEIDVVAFHLVTMGSRVSQASAELFERNAYRDYLELHGLSVQLTEALAEYWHGPSPGRAGRRPRGRRRSGRDLPAGLPGVALLLRLSRLPRPRGPRQDRRAAPPGPDRCRTLSRNSSCTPSSRPTR